MVDSCLFDIPRSKLDSNQTQDQVGVAHLLLLIIIIRVAYLGSCREISQGLK